MRTLIGPLDKLIGEGACSWVYSLKDSVYAIKISKSQSQFLTQEYSILEKLSKTHPSLFPHILSKEYYPLRQEIFGLQDGLNEQKLSESCVVMQRLGISLEQFLTIRGNLSLQTIIRIGQQLLNQLSVLIGQGISHNDIKPANVMFGMGQKRSKIYLIDYGFASINNDKNNMQDQIFRGNIPFTSTYRLKTNKFDAKNDLESFIYLMIWVLKDGNIPWQQANEVSFSRKVQKIIQGRTDFIQLTLQTTRGSFNKRDNLIHQLVSILSILQANLETISSKDLLQKLKTLF